MKFKLVHMYEEFNSNYFTESPAWGSYYEPDDIDAIVNLGFNREVVTNELKRVDWSDSYCFPIPQDTDMGTFMYEYRRAVFTTINEKIFEGYVVNKGHCICIFGSNKEWSININSLDILQKNINSLKLDLGLNINDELFPLKVSILYLNYEFTFPQSS